MHILLSRLLEKRKIKSVEELSADERTWVEEKQRILSQPDEITLESFGKFCQSQIDSIASQWKNLDNTTQKNERLITLFTVYSTLLKVVTSNKQERELLEDHLQQLLK